MRERLPNLEGQSYRVGMQLGRRGQKKFSIFISLALACHGVGRVLHVPTRPSSPAEMMTAAPQARDGQAETRAISKLTTHPPGNWKVRRGGTGRLQ